jgi:hypothetical protein
MVTTNLQDFDLCAENCPNHYTGVMPACPKLITTRSLLYVTCYKYKKFVVCVLHLIFYCHMCDSNAWYYHQPSLAHNVIKQLLSCSSI